MLRTILSIAMLFQGIPFPGPGRAPVGAAASVSVVQSATAQNASTGATRAVTLSGVTSGSTIAVWAFVCGDAGCTSSGSNTTGVNDGTAYTAGINCNATNRPVTVWYLPNASAGSHTITASFNGVTPHYGAVVAFEIAGVNTTSPYDSAASVAACGAGTGTSASVTSGATTSSADSALISIVAPVTASSTTLTGSGWTNATGGGALRGAYRVVSATGTFSNTWTLGASVNWTAGFAAFKP